MTAPDVLERVRGIRPDLTQSTVSAADPSSLALLERILATNTDPTPRNALLRRARLLASLVAIALAAAATVLIPGGASATARVARAARASLGVGHGTATMQVVSTLDGKPNNGTVTLAWNGGDESYVFNYPQQNGRFETRIVSGRVLQKIGEGQWTDFGPTGQLPRTGKLADGSSSLARIASAINFEDVGNDAGLRHYRALGDLSPLDSADAGFLFGTNGAPTGVTTSLEVWVGPNGLIQRVRTAFRGTPAGRSLEAVATTELNLTEPVRILDPLATS